MTRYRVIGTNGREYGPVSPELIRDWIGEGRLNAATRVCPEGSLDWRPLGTMPEFQAFVTAGIPVATAPFPGGRRTNGWAVCAFICGLISVGAGCCCCCLPVDLFGVVCSVIALVQLSRNPDTQSGTLLAIIGLILCLLSCVLGFIGSACWVAGGGVEEFLQEMQQEFRFGCRPLLGC